MSTDPRVHEALVAYTGSEPPLSFTYDQVLAGGRRARRRRRLAVATGAAAVAVIATGGVVSALPRETPYVAAGPSWDALDPGPFCRTASAGPAGPTTGPTSVVSEKNGYRIRIPTEPADHAAARISCYLATAVPPLLPGVSYHLSAAAPAGTWPLQASPERVFDPARPGETTPPSVGAEAVVADERGAGTIGFAVVAAYESTADAVANCSGGCTVRTGPNGETVTVLETEAASGYRSVQVTVHRGDTIVVATASNGILPATPPGEAIGSDEITVGRPGPPLTAGQLITLAADPALDLFE